MQGSKGERCKWIFQEMYSNMVTKGNNRNIGFLSTRFNGTDGVSLEANKWADVLENMGYKCFFFSGKSDKPVKQSRVVPEAFFQHPEIQELSEIAFDGVRSPDDESEVVLPHHAAVFHTRPRKTTERIHELKEFLKDEIYSFVQDFEINLLIVENALSIPLNIPLGIAITEFIAETGFPTIAHHHDFFWERKRFLVNCVWDYLNMSFPPNLPSIRHVVINSSAAHQLSLRRGISSLLIPNVMDFDNPPPPPDDYARDLRRDLGLEPDELLILQPTRVVQRKGIEHAIELVKRLGLNARLVISHSSGDEGYDYERHLRHFAQMLGVKTFFARGLIRTEREQTEDGRKTYGLADAYLVADLVTYPSELEGFGNAFLEAIYYRRPIVVNNYTIFSIDIKPKGFNVIQFDGYITEKAVERTREVLQNSEEQRIMVENNYQLAKRYYSYSVLRRYLNILMVDLFGQNPAAG